MSVLYDRVKVATATTGTGTVALGAAMSPYRSFAAAGASDGELLPYLIEDGTAWEIGKGVYSATAGTLSRSLSASSTGALINLSGSATVSITLRSDDVPGASHPGYVSGRWYLPCPGRAVSGGQAAINASLWITPFMVMSKVSVQALGARIITSSTGGNLMLAIYDASRPAAPRCSVSGISTTSSGAVSGAFTPVTLNPGLHYTAIQADNSTVRVSTWTGNNTNLGFTVGDASLNNLLNTTSDFYLANTYGSFPDLTSASFSELVTSSPFSPILGFEVA